MHSFPTHLVEIVSCEEGYRWIIRARSGVVVESSPYAFMSSNGARISGECWKREHFTDSQGD